MHERTDSIHDLRRLTNSHFKSAIRIFFGRAFCMAISISSMIFFPHGIGINFYAGDLLSHLLLLCSQP